MGKEGAGLVPSFSMGREIARFVSPLAIEEELVFLLSMKRTRKASVRERQRYLSMIC
jgi:hypothetical protein